MQKNPLDCFRLPLISIICATLLLTGFGKSAKAQQMEAPENAFYSSLFFDSTVREYDPYFSAPREDHSRCTPFLPCESESCFFAPAQSHHELRGQSDDNDDGPPKFYQICMEGAYMPSGGSSGLGMTRFKTEAAIMFPGLHFSGLKERSLVGIAPTFTFTSFDWKRGTAFPDQAYEIGVEFTLMQPLNEHWGFMGKVTPTWASDGKESSRAFSCSAMLGLRWEPHSRLEVMFGVMYLGQNADMSILPFGGVIWRPNDDWRIELMIPQAKIARRLNIGGGAWEHWIYIGAGLGGGSWAIQSVDGQADLAMYQDFHFVLGYELSKNELFTCSLELGYVFGREMEFDRKTQATFKPDDAFMIQLKFEF